jgi:hypothetical protein
MNRDLAAKPGVGISDAAQIAKKYDAKGCIILIADDDGYFSGFSWGVNKSWCKRLGEQLDYIIDEVLSVWPSPQEKR